MSKPRAKSRTRTWPSFFHTELPSSIPGGRSGTKAKIRIGRTFMARMSAWLAAASLFALLSVQGRAAEPLSIASQGYLFAGGKYSTVKGKEVMSGQIYAEYQIP